MKAWKRITTIALFVLASLVNIASASAQSHIIRATIPFNFTAGNKLMPAGTYSISTENLQHIAITNGEQNVMLLSIAPTDDNKSRQSKLVFSRYGDQFFLRKIFFSGPHVRVELGISKAEKKALSEHANLVSNDQVLLALNR